MELMEGLAHICPNQVSKVSQPKSQTISELTDRVKQLEDVLRHHGLDAQIPTLPSPDLTLSRQFEIPQEGRNFETQQSRAWDMTAMLGEITSSSQNKSKGYAGTEGSAFYLSNPDGNDTDIEGDDGPSNNGLAEFPTPWMKRAGDDWRGGMSGSLMSRCRAMLPSKEQSIRMFDHFWDATAWR
jgi:hypothetical protein